MVIYHKFGQLCCASWNKINTKIKKYIYIKYKSKYVLPGQRVLQLQG